MEITGIVGEYAGIEFRVECDYSPREPRSYWSPGYDEELEPYFPIYLIRNDGTEVECYSEVLMKQIEDKKWDILEENYPNDDF